jgi:hypothetical protein
MSDCVPYAIHIVTGEDMPVVMSWVQKRGCSGEAGMNSVAGWCLLRDMGYLVTPMKRPEGRATLKHFLPTLNPAKTYIISVKDHWFAMRNGERFDKAKTHPRTEVATYFEVQRPIELQAV